MLLSFGVATLRDRVASPDAGASDAHRSEAEAVDLDVATDFE